MKSKFILVLVVIVLVAVAYVIGSTKSQKEVQRLGKQVEIYKGQAEQYATALRQIREAASQAIILEKAPEEPAVVIPSVVPPDAV
jgi:type II secretory pathway pseudopilin PulG